MRYVISAILFCALGAPAASALTTMNAAGLSTPAAIVQIAKKSGGAKSGKANKKAESKKQDNGIHPLVGSGDY